MILLKPIIYEADVDIRFADLDFYGHVNSKHYLDLVITSRLNFISERMKISIDHVSQKGFGFYLTKSVINYKRPIVGLQRVKVTSRVSDVVGDKILVIPFEITNTETRKVFSDGSIEFSIVDLKTQRSASLPEWMKEMFFES